jgi:hypothetical protein
VILVAAPLDALKEASVRKDYHVPFRSDDFIKDVALSLRKRLGSLHTPDFNLRKCLELMAQEAILRSGKIGIVQYKAKGNEPPAYVTFSGNKILHVDEDVWADGRDNVPWAREILGHEVGHLALHNHYVQGFSGERSKAWQDNESSEWQADRFLDYFLITDQDIALYKAPNAIANHCAVEFHVVFRRLGASFRYSGECCPECGEFTLMNEGHSLKCDTCGCFCTAR